jgi:drug/metabolite transporter (DMT)-like permease
VLNAAAMISFLLAVAITPLAEVAALSFTSPLFATVLAAILLREPVGPRRIAGLVLLSCVAWGAALIVIKVLSRAESSLTITLYARLFLTPITLACALPFWQWPDGRQLVLLAVIGWLGSLTRMAIAQAFHEADASQVMPADLTKLVWSALIGWLFFAGSRPCGWWSAAA